MASKPFILLLALIVIIGSVLAIPCRRCGRRGCGGGYCGSQYPISVGVSPYSGLASGYAGSGTLGYGVSGHGLGGSVAYGLSGHGLGGSVAYGLGYGGHGHGGHGHGGHGHGGHGLSAAYSGAYSGRGFGSQSY